MEVHLQLKEVFRIAAVYKAEILADDLIKDKTAQSGLDNTGFYYPLHVFPVTSYFDPGVEGDLMILIGDHRLIYIFKRHSLALDARSFLCQIIYSKDHILGRNCHSAAIGGLQQVIWRQQKETALRLGFYGQGKMHSHLVTVEVGIESRTYQRMQLNGLALHQCRLKGLNAKTVQGGGAVQHNRMLTDDFFQNIPYCRLQFLHHFFCIFYIVCGSVGHQFLHNKGFEKLNGHLLWQTALIDLKLRSHYDYRTAGIIHSFAKKVLTETTLLSFQQIRKGFQRTVSGTGHRPSAASVVDQGVHRFLQHTFLIAHDNIRSTQLQQSLQTIIAIDDTAIQIIQV